MRRNLFEFLYGAGVQGPDLNDPGLGEEVVRLFEDADAEEADDMKSDKKPLATALKSIGVAASIETQPSWAEVHFADGDEYRSACAAVYEPDSLHKLAVAGWVPARCGDQAMANEPADFKLGFIELSTAETGDSDKAPDMEKVRKDAQERDTTAPEHDDEMNPVEDPDKTGSDEKQPGIAKAADGKDPEGTPKGSKKTEAKTAADMVNHLLEMTSAAGVPAFDGPPPAKHPRLRFKGKGKKTP